MPLTSKHNLGLHLRFQNNIPKLLEQAQTCNLAAFQFFLSPSPQERYTKISLEDKRLFLAAHRNMASNIFVHSSYWINPATGKKQSFDISCSLLKRELKIAKKLKIPYLVLHPGSATWHKAEPNDPSCKTQGINQVAHMLNTLLEKEHPVTVLLENTAHGNKAIGSDLNDFALLKQKLNNPDRIGYCLDLAHAFVYGYDLTNIDQFIKNVDYTMGLANIKLIHFNDAAEPCASKQDRHALPGKGIIGKKILQAYLHHPALQSIPKIIEPPDLPLEELNILLTEISEW